MRRFTLVALPCCGARVWGDGRVNRDDDGDRADERHG